MKRSLASSTAETEQQQELSGDWLSSIFADLLDKDLLANSDDVLLDGTLSFDDDHDRDAKSAKPPASLHRNESVSPDDGNLPASEEKQSTATTAAATNTAPATEVDVSKLTLKNVLKQRDYQVEAAEVIAYELSEMTLEERDVVYQDVHGVTQVTEETSTFIHAKLDDLDIELGMIDDDDKVAYNAAKQQNGIYTSRAKLRLQFLRSVQYNPQVAARRLVSWYDAKLKLFGMRLLTEDITMFDLCPEAQAILSSGRVQLLPVRDSAGRPLIASLKFDADMFSTSAPAKFFFYFSMAMLDDDEATQLTGVVGIHALHSNMVDFTPAQRQNYIHSASTTDAIPVKFQGFHFITERSMMLRRIANLLQLSFSKELRHRFRIHCGTFEECKYALMSYGIPLDTLPLTDDGDIKIASHMKWLQRRKAKDTFTVQERHSRWGEADTAITLDSRLNASLEINKDLLLATVSRENEAEEYSGRGKGEEKCHDRPHEASFKATGASLEDFSSVSWSSSSSSSTAAAAAAASPADGPCGTPNENGNGDSDMIENGATSPAKTVRLQEDAIAITPTDNDVLFGRGRIFQEHPGNMHLKRLIVEWYDKYNVSPRLGKMAVSERLVYLIQERNGRFLKKNKDGVWEEVDKVEAREKCSHGFRKKREMDNAKTKSVGYSGTTATTTTTTLGPSKHPECENKKRVKA